MSTLAIHPSLRVHDQSGRDPLAWDRFADRLDRLRADYEAQRTVMVDDLAYAGAALAEAHRRELRAEERFAVRKSSQFARALGIARSTAHTIEQRVAELRRDLEAITEALAGLPEVAAEIRATGRWMHPSHRA